LEITDNKTLAKVSDSITSDSNNPDVACAPVNDAECPVDESAAPESTPDSINVHPINSMSASEYSGGLFTNYGILRIIPGTQILPICNFQKVLPEGDACEYVSENMVANAVTRARGDANQNQATPIAQPEPQNQEVTDPPDAETANQPPVVQAPAANIPEPEAIPVAATTQCDVITPTNPLVGIDDAGNNESISTESAGILEVREPTDQEKTQKMVARMFMENIMHSPIPDNLSTIRYQRIYSNIPIGLRNIYAQKLSEMEDSINQLQSRSNSPVPTQNLPLPLPPPQVCIRAPYPRRTSTQETNYVSDKEFMRILREARDKKLLEEERELEREQERKRQSNLYDSDGTDHDSSHEPSHAPQQRTCYDVVAERLTGSETDNNLIEILAFKLPSFRDFFDRVAARDDHEQMFNQNWIYIRRRYFKFITPIHIKLMRVSDASSSPIYLKLSKTNVLKDSPKLSYIVDQETRAKAYRAWIVGIFHALQQDHLTARITDRVGKLMFKYPVPCYALKAASLAIQAKLDDICGGINEVSIANKKSEFQSLRIGENESATNFLTRALKVIDTCNFYGIKISEGEQINNIVHGLAGNKAYDIERKGFIDRRTQEKYHPDRNYLSPVTLQEMVTKLNNVDAEIYGDRKRAAKKHRRDFGNHSNNQYQANQAQTANHANVATSSSNQYVKRCFHCNDPSHSINKCKKATEEQKAACWAKHFADRKERQEKKQYSKSTPSGQVNQLFANNIYASGNSSNANSNSSAPVVTTSGPSSKKVKFTKKTNHAIMVSVGQIVVNYNGQTNLTTPRVGALKGVPPVHQA
jgi:hypothetical protein